VAAPRWRSLGAPTAAVGVAVVLGSLVAAFVDLEPRVEADFFFSSEDPQFRNEAFLRREFGAPPQLFLAVRPSHAVFTRDHLERLHSLSADLAAVPGVASVQSLTHGPEDPHAVLDRDPARVRQDLLDSPFWSRLLLAPEGDASLLVLRIESDDLAATVTGIDRVVRAYDRPEFLVGGSGASYVAEHIRRGLSRDLRLFSVAALVAFTALVAALFRSPAVVVGTLSASLAACFATFLVRHAAGMNTAILTPNLWTIAFVLTLSHVVYLTASYRRLAREHGEKQGLRLALRLTGPPSLWSLAANLLGFASLLLAPAKPLREFGISGGIAALAAIGCAYGLYPAFLRSVRLPQGGRGALYRAAERFFTVRHAGLAALITAAALALAPWSVRADTDPALSSYFARGSDVRRGIELLDRAGGTVPLDLVVRDAAGGSLADRDSSERLSALQRDLEQDPAVGAVISIALLMEEAKRPWYSFLVGWEGRLDRLDRPQHDRVGRTFISGDRRLGRFILRIHESEREPTPEQIIRRLTDLARRHGFDVALVGGMFKLQADLSELVRDGVERGLGGLLALFFVIALLVSRSLRTALAMTLCLVLVPLALFGLVTLAGMPLDIIAAPAANVALPLGIDEMIHLGYAVRRGRGAGQGGWRRALEELWEPILCSALIVVAGFALFTLSRFPPTQRLGVLVCAGAALTDAIVLLVLPAIAWRRHRPGAGAVGARRRTALAPRAGARRPGSARCRR